MKLAGKLVALATQHECIKRVYRGEERNRYDNGDKQKIQGAPSAGSVALSPNRHYIYFR